MPNSESAKYRYEYSLEIARSKTIETAENKENAKLLIDKANKQLWIKYRRLVWKITERQNLKKLKNYEKRAFTGFHLDHKVSIWYGFKNKIDPKLIGDIYNLEFIHHKENMRKWKGCNFENNRAIQTVLYV